MHPESTAPHPDEDLSALVDGEVDADRVAALSGRWRDDATLRGRWHAYQLIGDVLRSDDLASAGAARDAALWTAVRARLDKEPVVIAPADKVSGAAARIPRRWMASAAVAAGFVAVAGALVVTGAPGGRDAAPQLARAPELAAPVAQVATVAASATSNVSEERAAAANGAVVRDARLDRYLAAHQQFGGSSALGVPSGFLRSATYEAPSR